MPDKPQQEQKCVPISGFELRADGMLAPLSDSPLLDENATDMTNAMDTLLRGGRRNVRSEYVLGKLGIPIMHIWNQTAPFWDFHRSALEPGDIHPTQPRLRTTAWQTVESCTFLPGNLGLPLLHPCHTSSGE